MDTGRKCNLKKKKGVGVILVYRMTVQAWKKKNANIFHIHTLPEAHLDPSLVLGISFHPASVLGPFEAKEARVFDGDLPSSSSPHCFQRNFSSLMCLPLSASCHPFFPLFISFCLPPVSLPEKASWPDGRRSVNAWRSHRGAFDGDNTVAFT